METDLMKSDSEAIDEDMDASCESSSEGNQSDDNAPQSIAWANAMFRVLNTKAKDKNFVLSRGKKDLKLKAKPKSEVQIVDIGGKPVKQNAVEEGVKSVKTKRKEMVEKHRKKVVWESMCRVKPDILKKDKERELVKIATRGVVHLFNTVEKHQKLISKPTTKESHKPKKTNVVKGQFMDILKGFSKNDTLLKKDPVVDKSKDDATWSVLKDDFMMGAQLKDWDKSSDEEK